VNLQENAELIQRYLLHLRLRKEESEKNHVPTPWESLTAEEQLLLATYHAHIHQEEDLEQQIRFRHFLRDIRDKNQQLRRKRYIEKSQNLNDPFFPISFPIEKLIFVFFQCLPLRQELSGEKEPAPPPPWIPTTVLLAKHPNVSPYK
jgi:hypothetical protein